MSAFELDDDHLDYVVSALVAYCVPRGDDLGARTWTELGRLLLAENYRSVDRLYREDAGTDAPWELYRHRPVDGAVEPVQTIKAVDCYQYQACEHPGWRDSEAKRITDRLLDRAIECLPGMAEAAWVWRRPGPAPRPAAQLRTANSPTQAAPRAAIGR